MQIEPRLRGAVDLTVTEADTAIALGSGDVPVLGTPRVVALVEQATVAAVAPGLGEGQTTVGTRIDLEHLAASPVGATVRAEALLSDVDGPRLTFTVTVQEGDRVVAAGTVRRQVVDRDRFLRGLSRQSGSS